MRCPLHRPLGHMKKGYDRCADSRREGDTTLPGRCGARARGRPKPYGCRCSRLWTSSWRRSSRRWCRRPSGIPACHMSTCTSCVTPQPSRRWTPGSICAPCSSSWDAPTSAPSRATSTCRRSARRSGNAPSVLWSGLALVSLPLNRHRAVSTGSGPGVDGRRQATRDNRRGRWSSSVRCSSASAPRGRAAGGKPARAAQPTGW